MKFRNEYTYRPRFGHPEHVYIVVGAKGAMHFHVTDMGEEFGEKHGERYSGGLETHYRYPPDYMRDDAPSHEQCWVFGGTAPCWHDGTSLYARERVVPFWLDAPNDHERMFRFLEREYASRFLGDEADAS